MVYLYVLTSKNPPRYYIPRHSYIALKSLLLACTIIAFMDFVFFLKREVLKLFGTLTTDKYQKWKAVIKIGSKGKKLENLINHTHTTIFSFSVSTCLYLSGTWWWYHVPVWLRPNLRVWREGDGTGDSVPPCGTSTHRLCTQRPCTLQDGCCTCFALNTPDDHHSCRSNRTTI